MARSFAPKYLPIWLVRYVEVHVEDPEIFKWAGAWVDEALKVRPARDAAVSKLMSQTAKSLGQLTASYRRGLMRKERYAEQALDLLHLGHRNAYMAGMHKYGAYGLDLEDHAAVSKRTRRQKTFLDGLANDILTKDDIARRLDLYAGTLHAAYQEGQIAGYVKTFGEEPLIIWNSGTEPACDLCAGRNGTEYTRTTLPGYPSDGGFDDLCRGGSNCRCYLMLSSTGLRLTNATTVVPVPIPEPSQLAEKSATLIAAGLAVQADDTGRVLLIQRSNRDETDPARGRWEFPGGHIEDGEDPLTAAKREWEEEVGQPLPEGVLGPEWYSPDGVYIGFVYGVDNEDLVPINPDSREVLNPDDPDDDDIEVAAWWDPSHLPNMPGLRSEVRATPWSVFIRRANSVIV